ncbi:MAG: hypothetical protein ABIJ16_10030 [Bacteroidota bacterium]
MLNKTYFFAIILFVSLGIAFVIACIMLKLKGDSPKLIRRKLKAGAALLVITAFFSGCGPRDSDIISCYETTVLPDDTIVADSSAGDSIAQNASNDSMYNRFLKAAISKPAVEKGKTIRIIPEPEISCYDVVAEPDSISIETPDTEPPETCYLPVPDDYINNENEPSE